MVFQLLNIFKNPIQIFNFNDDLIKIEKRREIIKSKIEINLIENIIKNNLMKKITKKET